MNRPTIAILLATLVAVSSASAAGGTGKEYVLARKSVYQVEDGARNPFWPIGFKPQAPTPDAPLAPVVEALPDVKPENFVVTTISLEKDGALAVINGRTHGVGDKLPVDAKGKEFVTVRKIMDGAVIFDFHGQQIKSVAGRRGGH